jgi:uncharacterized protein YbjT (DUF2867 family)
MDLLARREATTVFVRDGKRAVEWRRRGADAAVGSLDADAFVSETLRNASGFFVLLPENVPPDDFHPARRRLADAIARAVTTSGVPHVVLLSALAAVLPEGNGPAKDLHYLEQQLRATGATVTTLRAAYFQDNVGAVMAAAQQTGVYPNFMPSADAAFPMIATADIGRFAAAALVDPPGRSEIVDLLGPSYSVNQVAERLGTAIGRPLQVVDVPTARHVAALMDAGMPPQVAEAVAELFALLAAGRIAPAGDRQLMGTTTIDTVIAACLQPQTTTASLG